MQLKKQSLKKKKIKCVAQINSEFLNAFHNFFHITTEIMRTESGEKKKPHDEFIYMHATPFK